MNLRKSRKAPRRYDDELVELGSPNRSSPRKRSPPNAPFNANLPRAAFPTLSLGQLRACENSMRDNHVSAEDYKSTQIPASPSPETSIERNIAEEIHSLNLQRLKMASASRMARSVFDNGPGNQIWESNMKRMEELGQMTDEDWSMKQMETSDEDESTQAKQNVRTSFAFEREPELHSSVWDQALTRIQQKTSILPPAWDTIPSALQIEMVYEAAGDDHDAEHAMQRLKLNNTQQQIMTEQILLYKAREAEEDHRIVVHQSQLNDALLQWRRMTVPQGFFTKLYENSDRPDTVASAREVDDAKAYMRSCGLDSSFLYSWSLDGNVSSFIQIQSHDLLGCRLVARYPHSVSWEEVQSAEAAVKSSLPKEIVAPDKLPEENGALPTPPDQIDNGQKPFDRADLNQSLPISERQMIDETIVVDVDNHHTFPPSRYPETPLRTISQHSIFERTPKSYNRSVAWPPSPPSPTNGVLLPPDSDGSDYEPRPKKQGTKPTKKDSVLHQKAMTSNEAHGPKNNGIPYRLAPKKESPNTLHDADAGTQSSGAAIEQEDSTIVVDVPVQNSTNVAHDEEDTVSAPNASPPIKANPKKRGRPKKSQG
ncbi:MAG: hypothetical protein Q9219_006837 [cf. Caloplaca sp. 3 TL-2023]